MANANWSNPTLTSTYTNFVSEVKNRDEDLALQFDGTTSTNLVTNTIRWDSSAGRWKKWNGSTWAELTATYALTALSTTGNANIGGTLGVTGAATLSSTLGVTGAITGSSTLSATALIPTAATVPTNGVYLPAANSVGISTNGSERVRFDTNIELKTAGATIYNASSDLYIRGGASSMLRLGSNNQNDKMVIDSSGRVGIGITSPDAGKLHILNGTDAGFAPNTTYDALVVENGTSSQGAAIQIVGPANGVSGIGFSDTSRNVGQITYDHSIDSLYVYTAGVERARIDSSGNVGIGTSSPGSRLHVATASGGEAMRISNGANAGRLHFQSGSTSEMSSQNSDLIVGCYDSNNLRFTTGNTERARIDSSGRLLVGTSSANTNYYISSTATTPQIQLKGLTSSTAAMVIHNDTGIPSAAAPGRLHLVAGGQGTGGSGSTNLASDDITGSIHFSGLVGDGGTNSRHYNVAIVRASVDGTPSYTSTPGRIEFLTTASGATSPTERLRIANNGQLSAVVPGNTTLYPGFMARAWVNFNGTGTVAIRGNGNVTSLTDNGVGDYTLNFATSMPDTNYAVVTGSRISSSTSALTANSVCHAVTYNTGSVRVHTGRTSANQCDDHEFVNVAIFR